MNKGMKSLILVTALGAGVSSAGVALAQGEVGVSGTMTVAPSTVEPGGSYVISNDPGSPCMLGQVIGDTGGVRPGAWVAEPDETGNWSVTIEVPENGSPDPMGNPTPFPVGDYEQHAFCEAPSPAASGAAIAQQADFSYDPVIVTVVAPAAPEEPTPPPPAPAAGAVTAAPTFTG